MESCYGSCHVQSGGRKLTNCTVWSFTSKVWPFGLFSGPGTESISVVWHLVCSTGSRVMLPVNCLWLLLLLAQRRKLPTLGVSCSFWDMCRINRQWVHKEIGWAPNLWFATADEMCSEGSVISVRLLGLFFDDRIHHQWSQRGKTPWLDDVAFESPPRYHHKWAANAITGWGFR